MKTPRNLPLRFKRWVSGSIRRKLTLFVLLVCIVLIALFWVFAVQLLEPAYNAVIRRDLAKTLDSFTAIINKAYKDGVPVLVEYTTANGTVTVFNQECIDLVNDEILAGNLVIKDLCIDISDASLQNIFVRNTDPIPNCALHDSAGLIGEAAGRGGDFALALRAQTFECASVYQELDRQMIQGKTAADGAIAVIMSANLERIPQAVGVLRQLMLFVSLLLIALSILFAFFFSNWFTRPIHRLSAATKEIVKGNYAVRVKEVGGDEIAALSKDFNVMAKEVDRSLKLQKDILANVSHDLRTPLTLIKGYAETVRDLTGDDEQKRTEQLNVIVDESDRLSALVGNVMELSRMSSGNERPNPVRFNLSQLCDEVAYRYQAIGENPGYHLEFSACESCDVYADPGLVERALHNLLGNAINHVGEDEYIGLTVEKTDDGKARVQVSDHGPGIAEKDLPHLFDRYYRSRSDAGKPGTGLGLSITKAIFEQSGFTYGVNTKKGEGSTFWFEAPLAVGETAGPNT